MMQVDRMKRQCCQRDDVLTSGVFLSSTESPLGGGGAMGWGRGRGRGIALMINVFDRMNNCNGGPIIIGPLLFSLVGRGEVQVEGNNGGGLNVVIIRGGGGRK